MKTAKIKLLGTLFVGQGIAEAIIGVVVPLLIILGVWNLLSKNKEIDYGALGFSIASLAYVENSFSKSRDVIEEEIERQRGVKKLDETN